MYWVWTFQERVSFSGNFLLGKSQFRSQTLYLCGLKKGGELTSLVAKLSVSVIYALIAYCGVLKAGEPLITGT